MKIKLNQNKNKMKKRKEKKGCGWIDPLLINPSEEFLPFDYLNESGLKASCQGLKWLCFKTKTKKRLKTFYSVRFEEWKPGRKNENQNFVSG